MFLKNNSGRKGISVGAQLVSEGFATVSRPKLITADNFFDEKASDFDSLLILEEQSISARKGIHSLPPGSFSNEQSKVAKIVDLCSDINRMKHFFGMLREKVLKAHVIIHFIIAL